MRDGCHDLRPADEELWIVLEILKEIAGMGATASNPAADLIPAGLDAEAAELFLLGVLLFLRFAL
jgi:hypothetical protein